MTIALIMEGREGEIFSVTGDTSVRDTIALLAEHRIGAVPVVADGGVAGVFSERDVIYCLPKHDADVLDWPVEKVMIAPAVTVTSDTKVLSALSLMTKRRLRHLPVVDDGKLVAFVSIGDLVKYRIDKIEAEAEDMRQYIQMA